MLVLAYSCDHCGKLYRSLTHYSQLEEIFDEVSQAMMLSSLFREGHACSEQCKDNIEASL